MSDIKEILLDDVYAAMWLIYGGWGVGKTYSLGSLPGKTMIILTEMKNPHRVLSYAKGKYKIYPLAVVEDGKIRHRTFDELMAQLNEWLNEAMEGTKPFDNLCVDSLSELQSIFGEDIEDDVCQRRAEDGKSVDRILDRFYKPRDAYIPLNSTMKRVTKMLQKFTMFGINVICTAGVADKDEFNQEIKPFFIAKEYPSLLSGFFDFVGYIFPNKTEAGEDQYPPNVMFKLSENPKSKCGDPRIEGVGGLNFESIFNKLEEEK